ncbi:family 43 glycosylhydrolase [Pseudomaricurvus alkylphenolicus]|uniref:family 43 glycosylhydrolase n=1 Tax=Pseudomaricurvus alkylphenolicus TaxID=1306991 RepID=UPI00141E9077|nr:family 43 glycosylhydrolase [Pseudomaricurvus alkylphenolicus]
MGFSLKDKWVWDFWFAKDGEDYHLFYLQADRALEDPELRHWNVSIGHAVSTDLNDWKVLPDAIAPSPVPEGSQGMIPADSCTTWTGCVIQHDGTWYMYYTGSSKAEDGLVQRVCLATSNDLMAWEKHPANPLVELDERWYDGLNLERWHDASWRDPWVMKDPASDRYHMLVTCRANRGENDGRGAIGYAQSKNLIDWEVKEPFLAPGSYGEMEVPQVEKIGRHYYLFCSVSERFTSKQQRALLAEEPLNGVIYYMSENLEGPYKSVGSGYLYADAQFSLYSGKVIQGPDKDWYLMGFLNRDTKGDFVGGLSEPMRINIAPDGQLTV